MAKMTCACEENCWTKHAIELGWPYMGWEEWKEFELSLGKKPEHGTYVIDVETSRVFVDPLMAEIHPEQMFRWPPRESSKLVEYVGGTPPSQQGLRNEELANNGPFSNPKPLQKEMQFNWPGEIKKKMKVGHLMPQKGPFTDPKDNVHSIPRMPKEAAITANEYFQSGQMHRDNEEMKKEADEKFEKLLHPGLLGFTPQEVNFPGEKYPGYQLNFSSGAKSSDAGTRGIAQISIRALCRIGRIFMEGIESGYERDNWKKGIFDEGWKEDRGEHAVRHLMLYLNGNRDEDHLAKVGWAMVMLMELEEQEKVEEENGRNAQKMQAERAQEEVEPFL